MRYQLTDGTKEQGSPEDLKEQELQHRQRMIDDIERCVGTLESIPYHLISTDDLDKLSTFCLTFINDGHH